MEIVCSTAKGALDRHKTAREELIKMMAILHAFAVVPIIKDPCPFARSHQQFEQAAHGDHTLLNNMLFALGTGRIRPRPGEQNASVGAGGSSSRNQLRQKEEEVLQSMVSFTCKEKLMKLWSIR